MHVGDSLESDVAGAKGVGSISVWLNRDRVANNTPIQPDWEIASLSELPNIVNLYLGASNKLDARDGFNPRVTRNVGQKEKR
jgi:hypothetical protein